jgi:two-component system NtrC family sensor kinase
MDILQLYKQCYPNPDPMVLNQVNEIDLEFLVEDLPKTLTSMRVGADRIRQIVLSLRNFSRLDEAEMKAVDIHEGIDSTLLILQHRLKALPNRSEIQVVREYGNLPLVECYAGQLNQVFMNVLANAIDALEDSIEQRQEEISQKTWYPSVQISTKVFDQKHILIRIADNGPGIPEEVQSHIFDPFFTTKPVKKGTGLGLSISYQIIEKHSGTLRCHSIPNQGTEFWIELPV